MPIIGKILLVALAIWGILFVVALIFAYSKRDNRVILVGGSGDYER